jgi:molybdopterin-guanine dinucleotide biosynthesis protein A
MTTYRVLFDTRNHKRACSTSFVVSADSPSQAQSMAARLLRQCGETPLHFKAPNTRPLTPQELLAMAG